MKLVAIIHTTVMLKNLSPKALVEFATLRDHSVLSVKIYMTYKVLLL